MSKFANIIKQTALGAIVSVGITGAALAAPVNFTWTPSAVGLNGGPIVNANNYNVADFASVTVNNLTGTFTETGVLNVTQFTNNGTIVPTPTLDNAGGYSLYLLFNATGTQGAIPTTTGSVATGTFTGLTFQLVGSTNGLPTFTVSNGNVTTVDPGTKTVLAYGSLVPGTGFVSLQKTANGFSPTANLNTTFTACAAAGQGGVCTGNELAFFTSPIGGLNLQVGNFSATDTVTVLNTVGNNTFVNITGGGGNLTFDTIAVPEPVSLALLGSGLVGLGIIRRRRKV